MAKRKKKTRRTKKKPVKKTLQGKNLLKTLFAKVKGFIMSPSKAFKAEATTNLGESFKYALFGLAFLGVLTGLIYMAIPSAAMPFVGPILIVAMLAMIVIFGFIGILLGGLWLHLWAYIFGARKGLTQTLKIVIYARTPTYYLGWIPFFSIIAGIWEIVLSVIGLQQLQKLSTGRAIGAVLIAIIIPLVVIGFIALAFFASAATTAGAIPGFNLLF